MKLSGSDKLLIVATAFATFTVFDTLIEIGEIENEKNRFSREKQAAIHVNEFVEEPGYRVSEVENTNGRVLAEVVLGETVLCTFSYSINSYDRTQVVLSSIHPGTCAE